MSKRDPEELDLNPVIARINEKLGSSDIVSICKAIGEAITLHDVSDIARKAGLERPSLYRAFGQAQHLPNFSTVFNVLGAMGLRLKVIKSRKRRRLKRSSNSRSKPEG